MAQQLSANTPRPILMRPMTWIVSLLLLFALAVGSIGLNELKAKWDIDKQLAELRTKGVPVDNESMESHFLASTSTENSTAWSEIRGELSNSWLSTLGANLPEVGQGVLPVSALSGEAWPDESIVAEYLEKVRPTLDKLHALPDSPAPVWQPIHFDGFATLLGPLQESRSIVRALALDLDHAVFHQDSQRALKDFRAMSKVAEAYRWENFLVADLVYIALVGQRRQLMQRSLQADFWTSQDLLELHRLVGESRDIRQVWPKLMASERAAVLAMVKSGDLSTLRQESGMGYLSFLLTLPSVQRAYLQDVDDLMSVGSGGIEEAIRRADKTTDPRQLGLLSQMVLPATQALAAAYVRAEDSRRVTSIAIGIKQFKLANQRFPGSLTELQNSAEVGINSKDLRSVDMQMFGYSVDGQTAYLWNVRSSNNYGDKILPLLPETFDPVQGSVERATGEVVIIR